MITAADIEWRPFLQWQEQQHERAAVRARYIANARAALTENAPPGVLADYLAIALDALEDALGELGGLRLVLQAAVARLGDQAREIDHRRRRVEILCDELRAVREVAKEQGQAQEQRQQKLITTTPISTNTARPKHRQPQRQGQAPAQGQGTWT